MDTVTTLNAPTGGRKPGTAKHSSGIAPRYIASRWSHASDSSGNASMRHASIGMPRAASTVAISTEAGARARGNSTNVTVKQPNETQSFAPRDITTLEVLLFVRASFAQAVP